MLTPAGAITAGRGLARRGCRARTVGILAVPLAVLALLAGAAVPASAASLPPGPAGQARAAELPALRAISAPAAWKVSTGRGVTVGVLDTGVSAGEPDLSGSVVTGPDYTRGADPPGYQPPHLHGTFIASVIAAHGRGPGRAGGVIGVAPAARIVSVRVLLDNSEPGFRVYNENPRFDDAISRGIRYAVSHGAGVINMSLGSASASRTMRAAIAYAVAQGVVVVAAAGNDARSGHRYTRYSYPASYPGVISVAALTSRGSRAYFSDRNASVVIAAPGVQIIGDGPGGSYLQGSGTSPASAFVAGVAALIRSAYPRLSPALVEQALISSARHRPARGYSPSVGFGEVDAVAALRAAGRLAKEKPATGLSPQAHVTGAKAAPVQVVHRDTARIGAYTAASVTGGLGFSACLVTLGLLARRARRARGGRRGRHRPPAGGAAVIAGPRGVPPGTGPAAEGRTAGPPGGEDMERGRPSDWW